MGLAYNAPYGAALSRILGSRHKGTDIFPVPENPNPLLCSVGNGRIVFAGYMGSQCGNAVDILLDDGRKTRYCHLQKVLTPNNIRVSAGDVVGIMGGTGTSYPRGFVHLHFVMWDKFGRLMDAMSIPYDVVAKPEASDLKQIFRDTWKRNPAYGEYCVFWIREKLKDIKNYNDMRNNMAYWYSIVYPFGKLSKIGDYAWQRNKEKWVAKAKEKNLKLPPKF